MRSSCYLFLSGLVIAGCAAGGGNAGKKAAGTNPAATRADTLRSSQNQPAAAVSAPPPDGRTFYYQPSESTISGTLCKMAAFSADEENTDAAPDSVTVVALKDRIAVVNPPGADTSSDEYDPNEYNLDTIQLSILPSLHTPTPAGQPVQLRGAFFHGSNAHHFTNVLMEVGEMKVE